MEERGWDKIIGMDDERKKKWENIWMVKKYKKWIEKGWGMKGRGGGGKDEEDRKIEEIVEKSGMWEKKGKGEEKRIEEGMKSENILRIEKSRGK